MADFKSTVFSYFLKKKILTEYCRKTNFYGHLRHIQFLIFKIPVLGPTNDRQRSVRDEFIYAWKAYKRHAWGHDNLAPLSHGFQDWIECGNVEGCICYGQVIKTAIFELGCMHFCKLIYMQSSEKLFSLSPSEMHNFFL